MPQIVFYLKSETIDKNGKVSLLAQVTSDYKPFRMKLGKVKSTQWNKRTQRLRLSSLSEKEYKDNVQINSMIDEIESRAKELFNRITLEKRKLNVDELKNLFFEPEKPEIQSIPSFFEAFQDFIDTNKTDKAIRTIMGYTTVRNFLIRFEKSTKYYITWDTLNVKFIDILKKYTFITEKKQNSYYAKITRVCTTFLHWSEDRNYCKCKIFDKLKADEPEKEVIFLTMDELLALKDFEFNNARLNKTRDLYCFSSFTGLRYSDVISIRHEHINGKIFSKTQKKTNDFKTFPLNNFALEILDRNKGNDSPLPQISVQKLNDYIKECCKIICEKSSNQLFNRLVIKKVVIGSSVEETPTQLYDAITFHTARKTFITNSIMLGINIKALQDMGAPKKDKDLKKYLKITDAFKSQVMDNTWNKITHKM